MKTRIVAILSTGLFMVVLSNTALAESKGCNTCTGCSDLLNDGKDVHLTANIYDSKDADSDEACIHIETGNVTFDCGPYSLIGAKRAGRSAVFIDGAEYVEIMGCYISSWGTDDWNVAFHDKDQAGIYGENVYHADIHDNYIRKSANGILLKASSNLNYIHHNTVRYSAGIGITVLESSKNNFMHYNNVWGNNDKDVGMMACGKSTHNSIRYNTIRYCGWIGYCFCSHSNLNNLYHNYIRYNGEEWPVDQDDGYDIHVMDNAGDDNVGDHNTCDSNNVHNWRDTSCRYREGCENP